MKKKNIITLGTVITFILIAIVVSGYLWLSNELKQKIIFTNNSNHSIDSIEIKYCDKILNLNDIKPHSSFSENIKANFDSHFDVKIIFSDGTVIEENNLGYITNSDGSDNIFLITENKELNFSQEY